MNLAELPEGVLEVVARHLIAPDLLNFLCVHPTFRSLSKDPKFWIALSEVQFPTCVSPSSSVARSTNTELGETDNAVLVKKAKDAYLMRSHCQLLPQVRWYAVDERVVVNTPSPREGHLACRMGDYIVLTGGFVQDPAIYVKDSRSNSTSSNVNGWLRILPDADSPRPDWTYGASLTALDETRAVRFGGFRAGGYSNETYQVAVLHLTVDAARVTTRTSPPQLRARWELVRCYSGKSPIPNDDPGWYELAARAYHATLLLQQRYLLVVGGMKSTNSILQPMMLDTQTWTWYTENVTSEAGPTPLPRHGCSLVHDAARNQVLLFGGGSGSDLLRSGQDYPEVWELDMNRDRDTVSNDPTLRHQDPLSTLPWTWRLRHEQTTSDEIHDRDETDEDQNENEHNDPNVLSSAEQLNLGRCHGCYHISNDTCLLAFGSGRPSTNLIIGYRLNTKEFFRPIVRGPLPEDRFTFASVHLLELGYIVFHGGYSSLASDTISSTCVLDLAPGLQRPFQMWPIDRHARSHRVLTTQQIAAIQRSQHDQGQFESLVNRFMEQPTWQQPITAAQLLASGQLAGVPTQALVQLIAGRRLWIRGNGRTDAGGEAGDNLTNDEDNDDYSDEESSSSDM